VRLVTAWCTGLVAATAAAVALGIAAPAAAYPVQPPPGWGVFKQCPVTGTLAPAGSGKVMVCLHGVAAEGTINIGGLDTTFRGPGVIQGGTGTLGAPPSWADALDGQSFSAPQQLLAKPVLAALGNPQGVAPPAQSQVYVVAQQAGPMAFGVVGAAVVTTVPLSFHLLNPLLGPNCYIGTPSDPVVLNLTTGTSGTLTGTLGSLNVAHGAIAYTTGTEVVDGQFSTPGATGCGLGGEWDNAIDTNNGLPSASGANEAILYGSFDLATARQVAHHFGAQQLPAGYPGGFQQMMTALGG
jgi:hypothetical protein